MRASSLIEMNGRCSLIKRSGRFGVIGFWIILALFAFEGRPLRAAGIETEIEKIIGRQVVTLFESQLGREQSPTLNRWVRRIGEALARMSPRQDIRYTFIILNTGEANAYAAPGAYIFITRGLLDAVESEDELASIIAHEVGHVARKHAIRQIKTQLLVSLGLRRIGGKDRKIALAAAQVLNALAALHKSRRDEAEADRVGFDIAYRAGYDPSAMLVFFERIARGRRPESRLERFFATHPTPEERIAQARRDPRVAAQDAETNLRIAQGYEGRSLYAGAAEHYRQALRFDPDLETAKRGLARILTALGDREEAVALWRKLARTHPDDAEIRDGLEEAECLPGEKNNISFGMPELPRQDTPLLIPDEEGLRAKARKVLQRMDRVCRNHRTTAALQQSLLTSPVMTDVRWAYLAYEAYETVERIEDACAKALRSVQSLPDLFTQAAQTDRRLQGFSRVSDPIRKDTLQTIPLATRSCLEAIASLERGISPLEEAERTIGAVLLDLNSPLLVRTYDPSWTRYGLEESLILYAKERTRQASHQASRAHRQTTQARLLLLQAHLDLTLQSADRQQRRNILRCLRRWLPEAQEPKDAGFGTCSLLLALAQETGKRVAEIQDRISEEWLEKYQENIENLYTILRMIDKEIAKETLVSGSEQSTVDYRLNRDSSFSPDSMASPPGGAGKQNR